jgi:VWFA-related protein
MESRPRMAMADYDESTAEPCTLLRCERAMRRVDFVVFAMVGVCAALAGAGQSPQPAGTPPIPSQSQGRPAAPPGAAPPPEAVSPASPAQNPAPSASDDGRVHLDVVVSDKKGNAIGGLTAADFTLLDNRTPRKLDSFQALGGMDAHGDPVEVVMAIDLVNISFDRVAISRQYVSNFLRRDNGHLAHPVSIVWVTDYGLQQQLGPSMDGNALAAQLDNSKGQLRFLNRDAGSWGAIERFDMTSKALDQMVTSMGRFPGRKLLIWVGPGWPMLDNPYMYMTWKQQQELFRRMIYLSTKIRSAQIEICSVAEGMPDSYTYLYQGFLKGVKKPSQMYLSNLTLKVMAIWSGGQVRLPSNDMTGEIARCVKDADAYYRISFTPPAADGPDEYHQLEVKVDKPGLAARTSEMYYNQPPNRQAKLAPGAPKGGF